MTRFPILSFAFAGLLVSAHHAVAAPPSACDLITVQTAAQAFGAPMKPGVEERLPMNGQQCTFLHAGQARLEFSFVDEAQIASTFRTDAAGVVKMMQGNTSGKNVEAIPSLGDWSMYSWNGIDTYTLTTIYHGKVIYLNCAGSKNPDLKASLVQTMRQTMQKF